MKTAMKWMLIAVCMMVVSVGVTGCGSDDDDTSGPDIENPDDGDKNVPVESIFAKVARERAVTSMDYGQQGSHNVLVLSSSGKDDDFNSIDWMKITLNIKDDPGYGRWKGRYELESVSAEVLGFEEGKWGEQVKAVLGAKNDEVPVKGAWVEFQYMNETGEYELKKYKVTLHVDEMTENNGNYARDINVTGTAFIHGS